MKVLLAALCCAKDDRAGNLARHRGLVQRAEAVGADLLVLPEMSLTGSVDPRVQPERLVALDDEVVTAAMDATRGTDVGVVLGIAERAGGEAYITQCVARAGGFAGSQRKRHLGEDEQGFSTGDRAAPLVVDHAGARVGVVICAESTVAFPFDDTVDAGAQLVCFCAAPGLDAPRRDDDGFATGLAWWESAGLHDMQVHAARRRVWVAVATQAGATIDEDFPGLAALIGPDGEVVARTSDWREATLVVDLPF